MQSQATLKYARTSARKARLVADLIRGMDVAEARTQLQFNNKKVAGFFGKLLDSAVANAVNNHSLNEKKLFVSEVIVNEGPVYKRWQPRAFGRAYPILKKTSHIKIALSEKEDDKADKKAEVKKVAKKTEKKTEKKSVKSTEKKTSKKKSEKVTKKKTTK